MRVQSRKLAGRHTLSPCSQPPFPSPIQERWGMACSLGELLQERHIFCLKGGGWVVMSIPVHLEERFSTRRNLGKHLLNRDSRQIISHPHRHQLRELFYCMGFGIPSTQGGSEDIGRCLLWKEDREAGTSPVSRAKEGREAQSTGSPHPPTMGWCEAGGVDGLTQLVGHAQPPSQQDTQLWVYRPLLQGLNGTVGRQCCTRLLIRSTNMYEAPTMCQVSLGYWGSGGHVRHGPCSLSSGEGGRQQPGEQILYMNKIGSGNCSLEYKTERSVGERPRQQREVTLQL